ncbi:MAG: hypothetical protein NTZ17_20005 [Phycisphaerae bacterium]|nr:hypothetical protein [Phycisphaerae bacterium]
MDEVNHNSKPGPQTRDAAFGNPTKRTRVLRATDVIPPFGRSTPPSDNGEADAEQAQALSSRAGDGVTVSPLLAGDGAIPAYDLADNILAEQRRAAGRRRRGPSRAPEESAALPERPAMRILAADLASQNLLELQRIVAEIVARDIERLCRRPDRSAFVVCSLGAGK